MIGDDPDDVGEEASDTSSVSEGETINFCMMTASEDPMQKRDPWKPGHDDANSNPSEEDEREHRDAECLRRPLADDDNARDISSEVFDDSPLTPQEYEDAALGTSSAAAATPPKLGTFAEMVNAHLEARGFTAGTSVGTRSASGAPLATAFFKISTAPNSAEKEEAATSISPSGTWVSNTQAHSDDVDKQASESPAGGADPAGSSDIEAARASESPAGGAAMEILPAHSQADCVHQLSDGQRPAGNSDIGPARVFFGSELDLPRPEELE